MAKSYIDKYYEKLNPIERMLHDYRVELGMIEWCKEQLKWYYKQEENKEIWLKNATKDNIRLRKIELENVRNKISEFKELLEEHYSNINNISLLMIEYKGMDKDILLENLKEIRWSFSKVNSGNFTTKPNKFYKYCNK